jgi:hypothetical protein
VFGVGVGVGVGPREAEREDGLLEVEPRGLRKTQWTSAPFPPTRRQGGGAMVRIAANLSVGEVGAAG